MLHVGVLALLQLSVVQAVISSGLVFLVVLAERFFGFHLGRRQSTGLAVTTGGLMVVAVTGGRAGDAGRSSLVARTGLDAGAFAASSVAWMQTGELDRARHPAAGPTSALIRRPAV
jgi:drug/metabolite transporter (DMT)-like permease